MAPVKKTKTMESPSKREDQVRSEVSAEDIETTNLEYIEDSLEEVAHEADIFVDGPNNVDDASMIEGDHQASRPRDPQGLEGALSNEENQTRFRSSKDNSGYSEASEDEDDPDPIEGSQQMHSKFAEAAAEYDLDFAGGGGGGGGFFAVKKHRRICGCLVIVLIIVAIAIMFSMHQKEQRNEAEKQANKTKVVVVKHVHKQVEKHGEGCVACAILVALTGIGLFTWAMVMVCGCCCYNTTPEPRLPEWASEDIMMNVNFNINPATNSGYQGTSTSNIEDCKTNTFSDQCTVCYNETTKDLCGKDNVTAWKKDGNLTAACTWNNFDYRPFIDKDDDDGCCNGFWDYLFPCCCGDEDKTHFGPGCKFSPCQWIEQLKKQDGSDARDALKLVCGILSNTTDTINDNPYPLKNFGERCSSLDATSAPVCPLCASNATFQSSSGSSSGTWSSAGTGAITSNSAKASCLEDNTWDAALVGKNDGSNGA